RRDRVDVAPLDVSVEVGLLGEHVVGQTAVREEVRAERASVVGVVPQLGDRQRRRVGTNEDLVGRWAGRAGRTGNASRADRANDLTNVDPPGRVGWPDELPEVAE